MTQQTFRGRDLREALSSVKATFGEDALVVSTQQIRDGLFGRAIEVVATSADGVAEPVPSTVAQAITAYREERTTPRAPAIDERLRPLEVEMRRLRAQLVSLVSAPQAVKSADSVEGLSDSPFVARLLSLGFSLELARQWSARLQQSKDAMVAMEKLVWDCVDLAGPLGAGGARVAMCVGPSGAGKTSTIAKWAAAATFDDSKDVLVVTLDTFRAGAVEQLRRYTDLIGCQLVTARGVRELMSLVEQHKSRDLILVDTAGRDPATQAELVDISSALLKHDKRTEVHLALPAMYGPRSLRSVVAQYRRFHINRLCFTKLDETPDFAPLGAVIANDRLPLSYWTTGQRIPEDIEVASMEGVIARIVPHLITAIFGERLVVEERFV